MVSETESIDASIYFPNTGVFANKAAELGLFSWASVDLAHNFERKKSSTNMHLEQTTGIMWEHFWAAYAEFRKEFGFQRPFARYCAKCNRKPRTKSKLKACGGACSFKKRTKPLYCNRDCQISVGRETCLRQLQS